MIVLNMNAKEFKDLKGIDNFMGQSKMTKVCTVKTNNLEWFSKAFYDYYLNQGKKMMDESYAQSIRNGKAVNSPSFKGEYSKTKLLFDGSDAELGLSLKHIISFGVQGDKIDVFVMIESSMLSSGLMLNVASKKAIELVKESVKNILSNPPTKSSSSNTSNKDDDGWN